MLYADILLFKNDARIISTTKLWLFSQFSMKDLGEASCIVKYQALVRSLQLNDKIKSNYFNWKDFNEV